MNIALVVVGKDYLGNHTYSRFVNRLRDVKLSGRIMTAAEVENFRAHRMADANEALPPEPVRA